MAFPFWWIGALTAGLFLATVFAMFGIALRLLSRTTSEIRGSMLPGLVSGFRDWAAERGQDDRPSSAGMSPSSPDAMEDMPPGSAITTEPLARR